MSEFWENRKEDWEQLKYLIKHKKDGHKTISVQLAALKPSQRDFNYKKVNGMAEALENGEWTWKPLLISDDFYIIDGHHRWKAALDHLMKYHGDK